MPTSSYAKLFQLPLNLSSLVIDLNNADCLHVTVITLNICTHKIKKNVALDAHNFTTFALSLFRHGNTCLCVMAIDSNLNCWFSVACCNDWGATFYVRLLCFETQYAVQWRGSNILLTVESCNTKWYARNWRETGQFTELTHSIRRGFHSHWKDLSARWAKSKKKIFQTTPTGYRSIMMNINTWSWLKISSKKVGFKY